MADKVLRSELYPYVETAFSDQKKLKQFEALIAKYIDKNSELLSAIGPMNIILFTDKDKSPIFDIIGVTPNQVKAIKNKSKDRKTTDNLIEAPFSTLMAVIVSYFGVKKNNNMVQMSTFYLTMSMYPFIYHRSFPYPPNENVMNYTINNLSKKFKIKQTSNFIAAIIETAMGAYKLHEKGLLEGIDDSHTQFVYAIKTRVSSFIKKIAREFYANHKEGKYLNTEFESNEEDKYREADSSIYLINSKADAVTLKLIIDGPPMKLITMAANTQKVSINELRNYITTKVTNDNKDDVHSIVESILYLYLFDEKNDIRNINSDQFLLYCMDVYRRSNTTDKNVVNIKKILDSWLEDLGTYKKTQRVATINNFRKAMYCFFVIAIMYYNQ